MTTQNSSIRDKIDKRRFSEIVFSFPQTRVCSKQMELTCGAANAAGRGAAAAAGRGAAAGIGRGAGGWPVSSCSVSTSMSVIVSFFDFRGRNDGGHGRRYKARGHWPASCATTDAGSCVTTRGEGCATTGGGSCATGELNLLRTNSFYLAAGQGNNAPGMFRDFKSFQ